MNAFKTNIMELYRWLENTTIETYGKEIEWV